MPTYKHTYIDIMNFSPFVPFSSEIKIKTQSIHSTNVYSLETRYNDFISHPRAAIKNPFVNLYQGNDLNQGS